MLKALGNPMTHLPTIRIATRQSPLALWQANYIKQRLEKVHHALQVQLVPMTTEGDKHLAMPLLKVGGKALFVKELEQAILENRADIAVHSMKDVPMDFPDGLGLAIICERDDPRDAFVSNHYAKFDLLPFGANVGTSSLRRQCQLRALRPDLNIQHLRGNVNSRLRRLDDGEFDAIVLAAAGLLRLQMADRINQYFDPQHCLPAVGQGAIGIEYRLADQKFYELVSPLNHTTTWHCVTAERALSRKLGAGCQVPVAGYAQVDGSQLQLRALVGSPDGKLLLRSTSQALFTEAEQLGTRIAEDLLTQGADKILLELHQ